VLCCGLGNRGRHNRRNVLLLLLELLGLFEVPPRIVRSLTYNHRSDRLTNVITGFPQLKQYYIFYTIGPLPMNSISRTSVISGGIAIGGVLLLSLLPSLNRWLPRYTPGALSSYEVKLVSGSAAFSDVLPALVVTVSLVVLLVAITVMVFQRQEL
jgi:hypothetical protein